MVPKGLSYQNVKEIHDKLKFTMSYTSPQIYKGECSCPETMQFHFLTHSVRSNMEKSRIRETKLLSTNADSSTDDIEGWTKNTKKTDFFKKRKKTSKTQKLKIVQKYAKISDTPFDQRYLIHREAWFPGGPRIPKNPIVLKKGKIIQNTKTQKRLEICQNQQYALRPEVSNPWGSMVSGWTKNTQKTDFF